MPKRDERIMTYKDQLRLWVAGNSVHNGRDKLHGTCCPDFSCCYPSAQWDKEKRIRFRDADAETREQMMSGGLTSFLFKQAMEVAS